MIFEIRQKHHPKFIPHYFYSTNTCKVFVYSKPTNEEERNEDISFIKQLFVIDMEPSPMMGRDHC